MVELYGKDLASIERQMILRICMDAICKSRGNMIPQLYSGANVICFMRRIGATKADSPSLTSASADKKQRTTGVGTECTLDIDATGSPDPHIRSMQSQYSVVCG